ncbi:MAG: efflux RND transporter periplasmic adaptor subunit [Alphaproteobacteria bacterium]
MRFIKNMLSSVWVWLILIGGASYVMYKTTQNKTNSEQKVDLGDIVVPESKFVLTKQGTVEVEGGIVNVSASRTGTFKDVYVKEGDFVKKGDLLALQEDRDDRITVRKAEIALENARIQEKQEALNLGIKERELERAKIQRDQEAISQQQYDIAVDSLESTKLSNARNKLSLENLETSLETARFSLAQRRLLSPVDGRILNAAVTAGAGVSADNVSTAFSIIPNAPKRVRIKLDEKSVGKVFFGQSVVVKSGSAPGETYEGVVTSVGDVFSVATTGRSSQNTVDVILSVPDLPFRLGQSVIVQFVKTGTAATPAAGSEKEHVNE